MLRSLTLFAGSQVWKHDVTRAERRKRKLVWRKTAPMFAPVYYHLRYGRYVPRDIPGADARETDETKCWGIWDRQSARFLTREELMRTPDDALWSATHGLN